jgi:dephospho-CoA kinase
VETGLFRNLDGLVVVTADKEIRIERVIRRDGCSREAVLARMAAQLPIEEKIRVASFTIDNSSTLERTSDQVLRILPLLRPVAS